MCSYHPSSELLIGNGVLCTLGDVSPKVLPDHAVFIVGDTIQEVGTTAELLKKHKNAEYIDAKGKLIMPGLICAHGHFYGMYARGMALKDEPPVTFVQVCYFRIVFFYVLLPFNYPIDS